MGSLRVGGHAGLALARSFDAPHGPRTPRSPPPPMRTGQHTLPLSMFRLTTPARPDAPPSPAPTVCGAFVAALAATWAATAAAAFIEGPATGAPDAGGTSSPAASVVTQPSLAEAPAEPIVRPPNRLQVKVTADVWIPRLEGTTSNGGPSYDLGGAFDLDGSEATFDGVAEVRFAPWSLAISGFDFSTSGSQSVGTATTPGTQVPPGDPIDWGGVVATSGTTVRSDFDIASAAIEGTFDFWRPLSDQPWPWSTPSFKAGNVAPGGGYRADLRFSLFAGARWAGIEQSVTAESTGQRSTYDGDWMALYGGLRLGIDLRIPEQVRVLRDVSIVASAGVGGVISGASGTYWQVRAGIELYPIENLALSAGYQLIEFDADDGAFEFDGGLQGLWVGGTLRF